MQAPICRPTHPCSRTGQAYPNVSWSRNRRRPGDVGKVADLDRLTAEVKRRSGSIDINVKRVFFGVHKTLPC